MPARVCSVIKDSGERCQATPLRDATTCFWHSPEHAHERAEASRLGGLRAKREHTVAGAFQFEGVQSVSDIRRLVEVAIIDTLSLDNSLARNRTLAYLAMVAVKLLEASDFEHRLLALESAVAGRPALPAPIFDGPIDEDRVVFTTEAETVDDTGEEQP
jgi:hypothetical protein